MADLILIKRRDRVLVVPDSKLGKRWLEHNIVTAHNASVTIGVDLLEDFIKEIEKDDITYEQT